MPLEKPKVAIVYLSYHSDLYLSDMVKALQGVAYPKDRLALVVVDNPHPVHGSSLKKIQELVVQESGTTLPEVVVLPQEKNHGFSGGNNIGISWALEHGYDYVFLHNQDGYLHSDCLAELTAALDADESIGCAQALIMLAGEGEKVNTAGNSFNYLGFGFIDHFGQKISDLPTAPVQTIGYASGAGLMLRPNYLKQYGPLDEDLFAYHEDVEYSLRLKFSGLKVVLVRNAIFYHKYIFNRSPSKFYLMERNRYAVLLMYYRWPTLVVLLPMLILMELGLLLFFIMNGWVKEKLAVYQYWTEPQNWKLWLKKRQAIQQLRKISDRRLISFSTGKVYFGEKKEMNNPLLLYVANPLMVIYRMIVKSLIFW